MASTRVGTTSTCVAFLLIAALVAACGSASSSAGSPPPYGSDGRLSVVHVHGVGVEPTDGTILLATHKGLFEVDEVGRLNRVGPVIDLMSFAVAGPGRFLASGHPGPGVGLPRPVRLMQSNDAGRTWHPISRGGQTDLHVLTVGQVGFLAYDDSLLRSADGEDWTSLKIPHPPAALAASPVAPDVVAATPAGLLRSTDGGESWTPVADAPPLQHVAWAGNGQMVVGLEPNGAVWMSQDGGTTWREGPQLGSPPQAVSASGWGIRGQRIVVATEAALLASDDHGRTFQVVAGN